MKKVFVLSSLILLSITISSNAFADVTCKDMKKAAQILVKVKAELIQGSKEEQSVTETIDLLKESLAAECGEKFNSK